MTVGAQLESLEEFKKALRKHPTLVVMFTAKGCEACKFAKPILLDLAVENPKVPFYILDIDKVPGIERMVKPGFRSIPTVDRYETGRQVKRYGSTGVEDYAKLFVL